MRAVLADRRFVLFSSPVLPAWRIYALRSFQGVFGCFLAAPSPRAFSCSRNTSTPAKSTLILRLDFAISCTALDPSNFELQNAVLLFDVLGFVDYLVQRAVYASHSTACRDIGTIPRCHDSGIYDTVNPPLTVCSVPP